MHRTIGKRKKKVPSSTRPSFSPKKLMVPSGPIIKNSLYRNSQSIRTQVIGIGLKKPNLDFNSRHRTANQRRSRVRNGSLEQKNSPISYKDVSVLTVEGSAGGLAAAFLKAHIVSGIGTIM